MSHNKNILNHNNILCLVLFLFLCGLSADALAQTRHKKPVKQPARKTVVKKQQPLRPQTTDKPADQPENRLVKTDKPKGTDSTTLDKVAAVVHDSIKAQLKEPIVQVPVTLRSLILPGAFFAYGAITLNNGSLRKINEEVREAIWDGKKHTRPYVEDYLLLLPAASVYALNIAGVHGRNNLIDRSVIYGMSNLIANGLSYGVKSLSIETRPDSSDRYSFPSGHTAEAFVSAEFFHQEYKDRLHWSASAAAYGVAITVAYLRMHHNKHWLSDIAAGAGIGIASTRFSYYLYPAIKHWIFGSKKIKETTLILPTYQQGAFGFALVHNF